MTGWQRAQRAWCRIGWVIHIAVGLGFIVAGVASKDLAPAGLGALILVWSLPAYRRSCAITVPGTSDGSHEPQPLDRAPR